MASACQERLKSIVMFKEKVSLLTKTIYNIADVGAKMDKAIKADELYVEFMEKIYPQIL